MYMLKDCRVCDIKRKVPKIELMSYATPISRMHNTLLGTNVDTVTCYTHINVN